MFKDFVRTAMKKMLGDNSLFIDRITQDFHDGKNISASLLTLYSMPLRNVIRPKGIEFIASEDYYRELHELLKVGLVEGFDLVRTGKDYDGGYIMLDDFNSDEKTAYSFGICNDVSWDKSMVSRGYDVFMYDHTIEGLPEENPHFHWSKLGIADGVTQDDRLKTLEELMARNGHESKKDMILKMDVEGAEWGFLEEVKPEVLKQFSQITFEFHDMINPSNPERLLKDLRKLNETHQMIHLHTNNYLSQQIVVGGKIFVSSIEASYVLRSKYRFADEYDVKLPIALDNPDTPAYPEIELGYWNRDMQLNGRFRLAVTGERTSEK